jgi:hypothetical protein
MALFDPPDGEPPATSTVIFSSTVMAVGSGCAGWFIGSKPHFSIGATLYTAFLIGAVFLLARQWALRYLGMTGLAAKVEHDIEHFGHDDSGMSPVERWVFWLPMTGLCRRLAGRRASHPQAPVD